MVKFNEKHHRKGKKLNEKWVIEMQMNEALSGRERKGINGKLMLMLCLSSSVYFNRPTK